MPVTLGVMALAALLAFGLLATTGTQPAAAQSADPCVKVAADINTADANAVAAEHTPTTDSMNGKDPSTDGCDSSSSEAIIELAGPEDTGSSARANYVIYGTDIEGSSSSVYPPGTNFGDHDGEESTSNVFYTGTVNDRDSDNKLLTPEVFALAAVAISVGPATVNTSGKVTPSKETITLSGAPLTTGFVYVTQGTDFTGVISGFNLAEGVTVPKTGGADSVTLSADRTLDLEIVFLGPPVATALDDPAPADADTNREPRSVLTITEGDKTISATEIDDIVVTADVKDAMNRDLKGKITYTVEFVEGSALAPGQQHSYTTREMDYDATPTNNADDKGTTHVINGWATGTNPVRINVSATFTGGTGTITLPLVQVDGTTDKIDEIVINRAGKLDRVEIVASCYAPSADAEERKATKAEAKICGEGDDPDDPNALMVDMRPRTVFRAGQMFTLKANALDTLGTDTRRTISLDLPDVSTEDGADAFSAGASLDKVDDADDKTIVSIHEGAPPGRYDLTLKAADGSGSDRIEKEATISIVVSGDPETYTVTGPENIALTPFASGQYTVKAVDAQGNPPNFDEDEDMVSVVVESDLDVRVTGLDTTGKVMLDEETGEATFGVFKSASAMRGDTVSIGIFVGDELMDQLSVVFGEPFMAPGMPMNVMAEATSDTMITVSWESPADDGDSDITGYMVQSAYMMADDMMSDWMDVDPAHMGMDMMYMDSGLMAETTYYYRVAAMNSDGMGEYSDGMAMAMTMAENMAPMAGDDVADQMVYVGAMVEVQSNFSDPDEDMLSYTATSDMMDVATATVDSAGMVTITGVAEGMATITVTASDPGELYAMQTIMVTVMTPNMAPMAGDDVADQMVYVGAMVEVQSNFSDPDEDMLSYTATSDMMDVATATVDSAGMVTITGVAEGMATITVTASDPGELYAMQTIMVTVMMMPPMELGAAMDLTATANDDGSITLMWTRGDNATHHFVSGNSAAVWEFAGGMSSHTVSIDKLVSGTEYTFYVISGRFMEADDGTWPGEWSSAGWTNAAKVTVQ